MHFKLLFYKHKNEKHTLISEVILALNKNTNK